MASCKEGSPGGEALPGSQYPLLVHQGSATEMLALPGRAHVQTGVLRASRGQRPEARPPGPAGQGEASPVAQADGPGRVPGLAPHHAQPGAHVVLASHPLATVLKGHRLWGWHGLDEAPVGWTQWAGGRAFSGPGAHPKAPGWMAAGHHLQDASSRGSGPQPGVLGAGEGLLALTAAV